MYCPKCGQEQLADVPNYCSRCGFQLTEVTGLVARGGVPAEIAIAKPKCDRVKQAGRWLLLSAVASFVLALVSAAAEGDVSIAIFGLLTMLTFILGWILLITSWARRRRRRLTDAAPSGPHTTRVDSSQQGALPAYSPPLTVAPARFDTGELVEPPTVTEHTTRQLNRDAHLEREPSRSRE
jgi:hypothetical protein